MVTTKFVFCILLSVHQPGYGRKAGRNMLVTILWEKKYSMNTEVHLLVIYIFWNQTDARKMEHVKMVHLCCVSRGTVHTRTYTTHCTVFTTVSFILTYAHFDSCRPLYLYMTMFRQFAQNYGE
jgi:hypothetical protein